MGVPVSYEATISNLREVVRILQKPRHVDIPTMFHLLAKHPRSGRR